MVDTYDAEDDFSKSIDAAYEAVRKRKATGGKGWEPKMGTKAIELAAANRGEGCLGKAGPNEPVFILRAQDRLAPMLVEEWALRAQGFGCPKEKVDEARRLAQAMREWPNRKNPD